MHSPLAMSEKRVIEPLPSRPLPIRIRALCFLPDHLLSIRVFSPLLQSHKHYSHLLPPKWAPINKPPSM